MAATPEVSASPSPARRLSRRAVGGCFADYVPALHGRPPFDEARHERSFGLWRADGSPKPAFAEISRRTGGPRLLPSDDLPWLDVNVDEFLADETRIGQLSRLYQRYCQAERLKNS